MLMSDDEAIAEREFAPKHNKSEHAQPEWTGAFGIYKTSRRAVMINLGSIVWVFIVNLAAGILLRYVPRIGGFISILFGVFTSLCLVYLYLAGVNKRK